MVYPVAAVRGRPHLLSGIMGSFTPTDISGLQLWLDFSDISTLYQDSAKTTPVAADGDPIGAAEDQSGNGNDATQATSANKPTYKTGIQNGLSVGRFLGVNDYMDTAQFSRSQPQTVVLVSKTNTDGDHTVFDSVSAVNSGRVFSYVASIYPYVSIYAGATLSNSVTRGNFNVIAGIFNGASSSLTVDGGTPATGNPGATQGNGARLGSLGGTPGAFLIGDISEILVYDSALSDADRASVETYLNNKWSVY